MQEMYCIAAKSINVKKKLEKSLVVCNIIGDQVKYYTNLLFFCAQKLIKSDQVNFVRVQLCRGVIISFLRRKNLKYFLILDSCTPKKFYQESNIS